MVSHDAAFLDAVATDVLLLAHGPRQLEAFRGRYSAFKAQRPEIHAYLTRRTDLRGNNTLAGGDKFSLTFPRYHVLKIIPIFVPCRSSSCSSFFYLSSCSLSTLTSIPSSFSRPDRLDGVGSDTKSVLRLSAVTFAYPDGSIDPDAIKQADDKEKGSSSDNGGVPLEGQLKVALRSVDCKLAMRSKVAVLGGNGAGKVRWILFLSDNHVTKPPNFVLSF